MRLWPLRTAALLVLLAGIGIARPGRAAWNPMAVPVCAVPGDVGGVVIGSDGAGGAIAAWLDYRNLGNGPPRLYAARLTAAGDVAPGWPANGVRVSAGDEMVTTPAFAPAGDGGAFVAWTQVVACPYGCGGPRIKVQRLTGDGRVATGWPDGGLEVAAVPVGDAQDSPAIVADGAGGAIVAWHQSSGEVRVQRVSGDGARLWNASPLGDVPVGPSDWPPVLAPDDRGGVYVAWVGGSPYGRHTSSVMAQHLDGSGASLWPAAEDTIAAGSRQRLDLHMIPNGGGGAILAWIETSDEYCCAVTELRMRVLGPASPGCPCVNPQPVTGLEASRNLRIAADGAGGALLVWEDARGTTGAGVYAQHVDGTLAPVPGWPSDGLPVCVLPGSQHTAPVVAADGAQGLTIAWSDDRLRPGLLLAYATRLAADGTTLPGWPREGLPQCLLFAPQLVVGIVPSAQGAIPLWLDYRGGLTQPPAAYDARDDLYAQRVVLPPVRTVRVALTDTAATPASVRIGWVTTEGMAAVERRTEEGGWSPLAWIVADAAGRMTYEDRAVVSGKRYGYRLALYPGDGSTQFEGEAWITVPFPAGLGLSIAGANPARDVIAVSLALPASAPARLELFDLAGRTLESRDVGALGPGIHTVSLATSRRVPAGLYIVRLAQGSTVRSLRVSIRR